MHRAHLFFHFLCRMPWGGPRGSKVFKKEITFPTSFGEIFTSAKFSGFVELFFVALIVCVSLCMLRHKVAL